MASEIGDIAGQRRRDELQTFDSGKHRQRRRDHRIAEEECRADGPSIISMAVWPLAVFNRSASGKDVPPSPSLSARSRNAYVFDGDDNGQRPDHERDDADDLGTGEGPSAATGFSASRKA